MKKQHNRFFLSLRASSAVSDDVAMGGHAKEIQMIPCPGAKILGVTLTVDDGWPISMIGVGGGRRAALNPTSPWYFKTFLAECWKDGNRCGQHLFHDVAHILIR